MNKIVLDSSVAIAVLRDERYDRSTLDLVQGAFMSSVNYAEVVTRLIDFNMDTQGADALAELLSEIVPFSATQSRRAGEMRRLTKHKGLSLGDRACLALAIELDADVYTADRAWADLELPCRIHLIR